MGHRRVIQTSCLETVVEEDCENDKENVTVVSKEGATVQNYSSCMTTNSSPNEVGHFGTVNIQESEAVHFGHKIFCHPITVVNKQSRNDEPAQIIQGSFKDVIAKSTDFYKNKYYLKYKHITKRQRAVCAVSLIFFITAIATCIVVLSIMSANKIQESPELILNESWFISPQGWGAVFIHRRNLLELPVRLLIISHTAEAFCNTWQQCTDEIKAIQKDHIFERRFNDIAYNYVIGGDEGLVYVGRGSNVYGSHTQGYNKQSIGVAFLGNYNNVRPLDIQLHHLKILIEELVKQNKLVQDYWLVAMCKINTWDSPGIHLVEALKSWPHWVDDFNTIENLLSI